MASNDYYNTSYGQSHSMNDAPLPPVPSDHTQHSVSPVSSPYDDRTDRPYPTTTHSSGALGGYPIDTSYSNTSYQPPTQYSSTAHVNDPHARQPDPFADQNAIPLQNHQQPKMDGSSQTRYDGDPEYYGMGVQPARRKSKKKKGGWFSGRITWVVYILTTVQIGVFVGELIKNGTSISSLPDAHIGLESPSRSVYEQILTKPQAS